MIRIIKKGLEYSLMISEDPKKIKESMEEYFNTIGRDRRFKFKWCAISGNNTHTFSGIFEFAGQKYYFSKLLGKLELEKI